MDGHGTGYNRDSCIGLLRGLDFTIVAQQENPVEYIRQQLLGHNLIHSGSTFTFARINKTKQQIEVINVGDSMTAVFKNEKLVYITPIHCFQNPEEIERTKSFIHTIRLSTAPKPVNDIDVTGLAPSMMVISYEPEDKMRVICGTDGFWDMKMIDYPHIAVESAIRLVNVAERKWKQQWMFFDGQHAPVQTAFDEADDIGIAIWDSINAV